MIAHIGEIVNIICTVLEGRPSPDVHISSPLGEITEKHEITFSAKAQHTGKYTCTANISTQIVTEDHYLYVYGKVLVLVKYTLLCEVEYYSSTVCLQYNSKGFHHKYGLLLCFTTITLSVMLFMCEHRC